MHALHSLAQLQKIFGRQRALVGVQIDDHVALAGLQQHRHSAPDAAAPHVKQYLSSESFRAGL